MTYLHITKSKSIALSDSGAAAVMRATKETQTDYTCPRSTALSARARSDTWQISAFTERRGSTQTQRLSRGGVWKLKQHRNVVPASQVKEQSKNNDICV